MFYEVETDQPLTKQERRYKTIALDDSFVREMIAWSVSGYPQHVSFPVIKGLPEGAKIVAVYHDIYNKQFCAHVYHESFEEVEPGMAIPRWCGELRLKRVSVEVPTEIQHREQLYRVQCETLPDGSLRALEDSTPVDVGPIQFDSEIDKPHEVG